MVRQLLTAKVEAQSQVGVLILKQKLRQKTWVQVVEIQEAAGQE